MASLGTLSVNIGANTRPLQQGLQGALANAKSFASGVMQTFTGMQLSSIFTSAVQQTKQMAISVVKLAADAELAEAKFSVLLGNAKDGAAMFKQLEKFALRTSFNIESASEAATMLLAKGVKQADVIGTMQLLGDLAMGDTEKLGLLAKAYTDVQAKGRLMAQEQNQFAENGINLFELLNKTTGKNAAQLMAMREAGQITFDMVNTALKAATSQGGKFFGLHALDIGQARARPFEDLGFFLCPAEDGAEPIIVITQTLARRGEHGLFSALEFLGGHAMGREICGEGDDDVSNFLGLGGFDGDLRREETVAGIIFTG